MSATVGGHRGHRTSIDRSAGSWRARCRVAYALTFTGLLGSLFTFVTAMTLALWATDPTYSQTNPVVDLAFFALGAVLVTTGIASQIRTPSVAGLQQAVVALAVLSAAGWLGGRVEPFVGALVLLAAATPLVLLHPDRRHLLATGAGASKALLTLAVVAAGPAGVYAADMLARARAAGPSCFLGQCVQGDRYAEAAALVVAMVLVALLASIRTAGWRLPAWCAGSAAVLFGAASLLWPGEIGAVSGAWAVAALVWGCTVLVIAQVQHRGSSGLSRHGEDGSSPGTRGWRLHVRPR